MQIDETHFYYDFNYKNNQIPDEERILNDNIQKTITSIIKRNGFTNYKINKRIFKDTGNGFLGLLCEADIIGDTKDGEKEMNIFAKFKAPGAKVAFLSLTDVYLRELYVYKELSKAIADLQEEFDVPQNERYKFTYSYDESNKDGIVLENLTRRGFRTYNRTDVISLEFAKLAIKELAKFHALSFAMEQKRPVYFQRKLKNLKQPFKFNDDWNCLITNLCSTTLSYLGDTIKKRFEEFVPRHLKMYKKYLEDESSIRCICHGDYRPANIMKKEIDGKITQVIPIDYQLVYYGNPLNDYLYFIMGATDQRFRRSHLNYLKRFYYEELRRFLLYFEMDVVKVFPRDEFENLYKQRLEYGLMSSALLLPIILAPEGAVPDIMEGGVSEINVGVSDVCKKRMIGLIEDFIQWGYL